MMAGRNGVVQVWEKVRRADVHLREVYRLASDFVYNDPYNGVQKSNPDTGESFIEIVEVKPIPNDLSLAIGDCIHNLRASLDYLVFHLVSPNVPQRDWNKIAFPVAKTRTQFLDYFRPTNRRKDPPIRGVNRDMIKLLKKLDACQNGRGEYYWLLHLLDIRDKHRLLVVAMGAHPGTYSAIRKGNTLWIESVVFQDSPIVLKPGNQIPLPALVLDDEEHFEYPPQIIFNEPEVFADSADVVITLSVFMELVIATVGALLGWAEFDFEPLTRQEGYVMPKGIFPL